MYAFVVSHADSIRIHGEVSTLPGRETAANTAVDTSIAGFGALFALELHALARGGLDHKASDPNA
jgi:hypothetical protein